MNIDETAMATRFGATIHALRKRSGLSMHRLAAKVGISQPYLSQLERGLATPSMATIYRLASAFEVPPGTLLPSQHGATARVVRSHEGEIMRVSERVDSASMRMLSPREGDAASVREYTIHPGEYLEEWFTTPGALCIYVISGALVVEMPDGERHELTDRDYISVPSDVTQRWIPRGEQETRLLCVAFDS